MSEWRDVIAAVAEFFLYAVIAVFAQNAVFTRALGVSRLVHLVDDDNVSSATFAGLLTAVQLVSAPLGYFANVYFLRNFEYRLYVRPLVFVLCSAAAFFIVLVLVVVLRSKGAPRIIPVLPMATFNCCILGTLMITTTQSFTLLQTMGFALGTSLGYALALIVVTEGQRRLQNPNIPAPFRGLPATLLYIGIVALAIYGFTGHMSTF